MASVSDERAGKMDDKEDELVVGLTECTLCTEPLSSPKFLPCFHCFCRACVEKLCYVHEDDGVVPCPLCRSHFGAPKNGDCRRLPTNVYAEELVRVSGVVKRASNAHLLVAETLADVKGKLAASEDGRQRALDEKLRREQELAEARTQLEGRAVQVEELKRSLSDAETRQRTASDRLSDVESGYEAAKTEVESLRKEKMKAEACLEAANESCRKLSSQLQQTRQETSEQASSLETELGKSKKEIESLKDQLKHMSALAGTAYSPGVATRRLRIDVYNNDDNDNA